MHLRDLPEVERLTAAEKMLLAEELWESIATDESAVAAPESHLREVERRRARIEADPGRLLTLEELRGRVEARR